MDNEIRNMRLGNQKVPDYFQDIKNKADRLANLGAPVNDSNLVMYAINGLGKKFKHIARIVRHRETLSDFETTRSMVLLEETVLNNEEDEPSSFSTSSSSPTVRIIIVEPVDANVIALPLHHDETVIPDKVEEALQMVLLSSRSVSKLSVYAGNEIFFLSFSLRI
ncbi:hypothetical protein Tco_0948390 [Tanacetum coccineum]